MLFLGAKLSPQAEPTVEDVAMSLNTSSQLLCDVDDERPLEVITKNLSDRDLHFVSFDVIIKFQGRSTEYRTRSYERLSSDKIVPAGEISVECFPLPSISDLMGRHPQSVSDKPIFRVETASVSFQ